MAQTLYSVSLGISVMSSLILGYIYDKRGPRFAGLLGAAIVTLCNILIVVALKIPKLSFLVWIAFPLCDTAGGLVSLAVWGFTWHFPMHQALVSSLFMASTSTSSCMAFVATWLVSGVQIGGHDLKVSPVYVWLIYSICAVGSAALLACSAATSEEFHREASAVTGRDSKPIASHMFKASRQVCRTWGRHCFKNTLFNCFAVCSYCWIGSWASAFVQLVDMTLTAEEGVTMLQLFAIVAGLMSGVVQPFVGYSFDRIGLPIFFTVMNIVLLSNVVVMNTVFDHGIFRPYHVQVASLFLFSFVQTSWAVVVLRWNVYFVPPALNGTAMGVTFALAGAVQMIAVGMSGPVVVALGKSFATTRVVHGHTVKAHSFSDLEVLLYPILFFGLLGSFFGILCNLAICCKGGTPKDPPTIEQAEGGGVYGEIAITGAASSTGGAKRRARGSLAWVKTVN